jgi:hypothetical protein
MRPCPADAWGDRFLRVDRATVEAATDPPKAAVAIASPATVETLTSPATAGVAATPRRLAEAALGCLAPEQPLMADPVDLQPPASIIRQVERQMYPLQLGNLLTSSQ